MSFIKHIARNICLRFAGQCMFFYKEIIVAQCCDKYLYVVGKRFPPGPSNKFRHHSVDDDYYAYGYPYGYYNGNGYHDKFGMHYSSQPSLVRPGGQRDSKYQHPHARYGAGQVSSMP